MQFCRTLKIKGLCVVLENDSASVYSIRVRGAGLAVLRKQRAYGYKKQTGDKKNMGGV
jgi:hypothetical protein